MLQNANTQMDAKVFARIENLCLGKMPRERIAAKRFAPNNCRLEYIPITMIKMIRNRTADERIPEGIAPSDIWNENKLKRLCLLLK